MWTKPYGTTGKDISAVSFGGMRFEEPDDLDAGAEIVLHAHRRGINYFDTAPGYFAGQSEKIMGAAFARMPRESFYCSSKCMAADAGEFRASLETSLKRMRVETIDFFHIWCIVRPAQWDERKAGGAVAAAIKAKEEGLIGHVVVSVHLAGDEICAILREGLVEGLTVGYNALNVGFRGEALDCAAELGLGVVTMNPLGGGVIPTHAERLDFLREPGDRDVVEAAVRFNVSHPAVTSALVGFGNAQQVDQCVDAVAGFDPHDAATLQRVKDRVGERFGAFCTLCGYCLPCPADVEIPKLMESYNYKILSAGDQAEESIQKRLGWHWGLSPDAAAACTQCGQCEDRCTQHLPIRQRLEEIAALAE